MTGHFYAIYLFRFYVKNSYNSLYYHLQSYIDIISLGITLGSIDRGKVLDSEVSDLVYSYGSFGGTNNVSFKLVVTGDFYQLVILEVTGGGTIMGGRVLLCITD